MNIPEGGQLEDDSNESSVFSDDSQLVRSVQSGDEVGFVAMRDRYQAPMMRLAAVYASDRTTTEEIVRETWAVALQRLDQFDGRSSLKTWLFRILIDRAKSRAATFGRNIPFAARWNPDHESAEPAVDPDRFLSADFPRYSHWWEEDPSAWDDRFRQDLHSPETQNYLAGVVAALPASWQELVILRDIEGCTPSEVSELLRVTKANQEMLLQRARSKLRNELEQHFNKEVNTSTGEELTCKELVEDVVQYIEGSMPEAERKQFEEHLYICPGCRIYVDQMRITIETLGNLPTESLSTETQEDIYYLFQDWKPG